MADHDAPPAAAESGVSPPKPTSKPPNAEVPKGAAGLPPPRKGSDMAWDGVGTAEGDNDDEGDDDDLQHRRQTQARAQEAWIG